VHFQQADRRAGLHDAPTDDLFRLIGSLRLRHGGERVLQFLVRGVIASGLALVALSVGAWLDWRLTALTWLAATPMLTALGVALARWPSPRETALAADRRFVLDDRLATAVELVSAAKPSRFTRLQVADAVAHAHTHPRGTLALGSRTRNEAALAAGALALGLVAMLVLPAWPRPGAPPDGESIALENAVGEALASRALPDDTPGLALTDASLIDQAQPDADLASRVQQEQGERAALDNLARALGSVSASQGAADAIEQGDFASARDQLQNLGEEADQLSDAAKQQLARALQQAAGATTQTDRQLADRERQAAQALARPTYSDQRSALRGLADQVERSGERAAPADQLARDVGQLQQQRGGAATNGPGARGQSPAASDQQGAGADTTDGAAAAPSEATQAAGGQGGAAAGQQGGAGVGTGTSSDLYANQSSRLDTAGQQVQVPTKLGQGPGVRPPDGNEDQIGADPTLSGQNISELAQPQQTGQVAPEQNLVPGEQRPVVRGYFR
jgi:hypothetical protein